MSRARHWIGGWISLTLILAGCHGSPPPGPPKPPFQGVKLVAAVLGDQGILPGIRSQRGEWVASSGADLVIADKSPADAKSLQGVDVLIFPGDRLGDLADQNALLVIDDAMLGIELPKAVEGANGTPEPLPDPTVFKEVAQAFRDRVTKYGDDRLALPLGGTGLVLAYQRNAFERDENKAAAKAAGIALEPPRTWSELDALAKFFNGRDWDGDGKPDSGIALAWANDSEGVGDATFLARAASLGQHRDQYSFLFDSDRMRPRIASPPFVEALRGYVDLLKLAPADAARFDADAARSAFRAGKVALLIDRAERASTWSEGKSVGVAPLPGSERVYDPDRKAWETSTTLNRPAYLPRGGGWLVGVIASTANREAALDLARYLAGPDVTNRLRSDPAFPMLPARGPQIVQGLDTRAARGVEARGWSDAVGRTIQAARVVIDPRVPDSSGYLADLARGRIAAVNGQPAEAALKQVADAWDARTKPLGRERQSWHYRRSLNKIPTLNEPPPRGQ